MTDPLALVGSWPVERAAVAVLVEGELVVSAGPLDHPFPLASVSKLLSAWATLVACEEGTISLDEPAGPPGASVRHLLAHAAGYAFDGDAIAAPPGRRRIYSNTGYEVLSTHVSARSGLPFATYLREAVLDPLGMTATIVEGSPAKDFVAPLGDLVRFAAELARPRLVAPETAAAAREAQFPVLAGLVPGVGRFDPCPWGLGPELRGRKSPHWTGTRNDPATFGHFGGTGTFLWVDPVADVAAVVLTDRPFGDWALAVWPQFSDAVLETHGARP